MGRSAFQVMNRQAKILQLDPARVAVREAKRERINRYGPHLDFLEWLFSQDPPVISLVSSKKGVDMRKYVETNATWRVLCQFGGLNADCVPPWRLNIPAAAIAKRLPHLQ
ncbi:MAG: hypothetical protein ACK55Z_11720, partial [bacterium]